MSVHFLDDVHKQNDRIDDNAAIQFLLTTEAGSEVESVEARALATIIGLKMWREAVKRLERTYEQINAGRTSK